MTDINAIAGTSGGDSIRGTDGNDAIAALGGSDTVRGMEGDDVVLGGGAGDRIEGDRGNDALFGNTGNDVLLGGRGNDILHGGLGNDVLTGGLDSDTFVFTAVDLQRNGMDVVTDFRLGEDSLSLVGLKITNVERGFLNDLTTMNGEDLANGARSTDLTITVVDLFGRSQKIVLLDSWSSSMNAAWDAYLSDLGYSSFA